MRAGAVDESVDYILKSRFVQQSERQYPYNALHIFAENDPANRCNESMLRSKANSLLKYLTRYNYFDFSQLLCVYTMIKFL